MERNSIGLEGLIELGEYRAVLSLFQQAKEYLEQHQWCKRVLKGWHSAEYGIYEKLGVFLLEIEPVEESIGHHVWVVVGDLPTVYIDDSIKTTKDALAVYCELMEEWADNILTGHALEECYPVEAEPTEENAHLLKQRTAFIKKEMLQAQD